MLKSSLFQYAKWQHSISKSIFFGNMGTFIVVKNVNIYRTVDLKVYKAQSNQYINPISET